MTDPKQTAWRAVTVAKRTGDLVEEPCEMCGQFPVHAHHDDYAKPLAVRWLCPAHHRRVHAGPRVADPRTVSLRVRVTPDELAELKRVADAERRTVSQLVWIAVQNLLRERRTT